MLVVAKAERLQQIQAIAAKWELTATPIGRVTDDGMYRATWKQRVVVEIPGQRLIEDCPVYSPAAEEDPEIRRRRAQRPSPESPVPSPAEALLRLLDHPAIASKRWVYEQYDSTVRAGTVIGPGGDAGVIRVRDAAFGIAVTTDGNARYVLLDPFEGGKAAVAEAARNIACTGARPLGITNCLNFGSPERPAVFYQFREACRGIADACRALDTPVTGGNVSFYNESPTGAVDPTPVIGMVGLVGRVDRAVPSHARARGDVVFLVGETHAEVGGSVLWEALYGLVAGTPPRVDLAVERRLVDFLATGAERALFRSAHDCSQGGLGVAYLGLYSLQHRGQESSGIVAVDGQGVARSHRGMGLVSDVFNEKVLSELPGDVAIGHTRYSTAGTSVLANAQPMLARYREGPLALAHNGNLTNAVQLRSDLVAKGSLFQSSSDSEVLVHLIARSEAREPEDQLLDALERVEGAYSLLITVGRTLYAIVDPRGFRPLVLGRLGRGWVVASETCALDITGATLVRELEPGDFVRIHGADVDALPRLRPPRPHRRCVFELVYFSRPDSTVFHRSVDGVRRALGRELAREHPAPGADCVFSVPDSSNAMALGFSEQSGVKLEHALIRNHYVGRTFIHPAQADRMAKVKT